MDKYTESMYYQIKLTEKICKIFCKQIVETLNLPISMDEFTMLNIIKEHNGDIHQRDIAKMLFKDRANIGKMLNKLEEKGYIERTEEIRNKRQVNILTITENGSEAVEYMRSELDPIFNRIKKRISEEEEQVAKRHLQNVRDVITEAIELDI